MAINQFVVETLGDIDIDSAVDLLLPIVIEILREQIKRDHDQASNPLPKIEQRS